METVLHSFPSQSGDGSLPLGGLVLDKQGNLYGTTASGGANNAGTVFELTPDGVERVLFSFGRQSGECFPYAGLALDKRGNLYGTTYEGGTHNGGTVFKPTPTSTETVLEVDSAARTRPANYAARGTRTYRPAAPESAWRYLLRLAPQSRALNQVFL